MPKNKKSNLIKRIIIVSVPILIFVSLYLFFDIKARLEFQQVYNEVERIGTEVIEPMGGVQIDYEEVYSVSRGRDLSERWACVSVRCPNYSSQWFVPIKTGLENEILYDEIIKRSGYTYGTEAGAWERGAFRVSVGDISFPRNVAMPNRVLPEGEEWLRIDVHVHLD